MVPVHLWRFEETDCKVLIERAVGRVARSRLDLRYLHAQWVYLQARIPPWIRPSHYRLRAINSAGRMQVDSAVSV